MGIRKLGILFLSFILLSLFSAGNLYAVCNQLTNKDRFSLVKQIFCYLEKKGTLGDDVAKYDDLAETFIEKYGDFEIITDIDDTEDILDKHSEKRIPPKVEESFAALTAENRNNFMENIVQLMIRHCKYTHYGPDADTELSPWQVVEADQGFYDQANDDDVKATMFYLSSIGFKFSHFHIEKLTRYYELKNDGATDASGNNRGGICDNIEQDLKLEQTTFLSIESNNPAAKEVGQYLLIYVDALSKYHQYNNAIQFLEWITYAVSDYSKSAIEAKEKVLSLIYAYNGVRNLQELHYKRDKSTRVMSQVMTKLVMDYDSYLDRGKKKS